MLTIYQSIGPVCDKIILLCLGMAGRRRNSKTTLQNMQFSKQLIAQGPAKNPRTILLQINTVDYKFNPNFLTNWSFIDKSELIIGKDCSIIEVK